MSTEDWASDQACVALWLNDPLQAQCHGLVVPGQTPQDAYSFLQHLDGDAAGAGTRQFLAGATWEPIRRRYQAVDRALAEAARARLSQLGSSPSVEQLEAIVRQASAQRTAAARLWRLPSGPDAFVAAEFRDWKKYGPGGRSFGNLMNRSTQNPARATWSREQHLMQILRSVETTNPAVDAAVLRTARHLRAGGAILMVAGVGWTLHQYNQTPATQRGDFARREGAAFAGSALATGLATAVLVTLAASGAVIIGVGLVAGVAGGMLGEGLYRSLSGHTLASQIRDTGVISSRLIERHR